MDDSPFTALLWSFVVTPSRRAALRLLAISAFSGVLTSLLDAGQAEEAAAKRSHRRHTSAPRRHENDQAGAEKKKKKKKKKKSPPPSPPPPTPPTPPPGPTRQLLTQTFTNTSAITINDNAAATPYPSEIVVSGFTNGVITDVNVSLTGLNHTFPGDIDMLLAATHITGRNALLLSDIGGANDAVNVDLVFDDNAPTPIFTATASGTFQPSNSATPDPFPAPAPTPTNNSLLLTFNGQNPNGTWAVLRRRRSRR